MFRAGGVAKADVAIKYSGSNGESEPRDVRSFVAEVLMTWIRGAAKDYV
jgi:hypothetical protein